MPAPLLHPFGPTTTPRSDMVTIVSGDGAIVRDDRGNTYIDAMGSLWYANIGYGSAEMAAAIGSQTEKLGGFHTFSTFTNEPAEELAVRVAQLSPFDSPRVLFCTSGSEAVDSVMKTARVIQGLRGAPERTVIIGRDRAYHGVNYGGTSLSGLAMNREGFGPFVAATVNVDADDLGKMEATLNQYSGEVAAVITEPVQGAAGVWPPPDGYLEGLRALCDEHGALLIFDEVITGFGRLGTWFAAQRFGVRPDLISFAKAITSGYLPLGGMIVGDESAAALESSPGFVYRHGYTYSGHPTVCAAGLKNLDIMERDGLVARALDIEERLGTALRDVGAGGRLSDVRGVGGMWGVSMPEGVDETAISVEMRHRGVLARPAYGHLVMCPPLVTTDDQLDQIAEALSEALTALG